MCCDDDSLRRRQSFVIFVAVYTFRNTLWDAMKKLISVPLERKATRITLGTATWLNLSMFSIRRAELF